MDTALPPTASSSLPAHQSSEPRARHGGKWIIAALLALGIVPVALGIVHLATVAAGIDVSAKAVYFLRMPLPIGMHVIGALIYVVLGPFQFSAGLRRRAPNWHRISGRVLVVAGLLVAVSALWMTLTLPHRPGAGDLLYAARLLFGTAMIASIAIGFRAILRGQVPTHRRWMTRAYAIGLGAATQVPVLMVAEIVAGPPSELLHAVLMSSAWIVNLAIAEWRLRQPARTPSRPRPDTGMSRRLIRHDAQRAIATGNDGALLRGDKDD